MSTLSRGYRVSTCTPPRDTGCPHLPGVQCSAVKDLIHEICMAKWPLMQMNYIIWSGLFRIWSATFVYSIQLYIHVLIGPKR